MRALALSAVALTTAAGCGPGALSLDASAAVDAAADGHLAPDDAPAPTDAVFVDAPAAGGTCGDMLPAAVASRQTVEVIAHNAGAAELYVVVAANECDPLEVS